MPERSSISVTEEELASRINRPAPGDSFETVSRLLGGEAFKQETSSGKRRAFWDFHVTDRAAHGRQHEIYLGEFQDDQLMFGSIIPGGSTGVDQEKTG